MVATPVSSLPSGTSTFHPDLSLHHPTPAAAIEALPTELLVRIIELAALARQVDLTYGQETWYDDVQNYYPKLHILAQTCRFWATVVKESPELWWKVDTDDPRPVWKAAIKRSQNYPIQVQSSSLVEPFDQEFWSSITPQIHRWESAFLPINSHVALNVLDTLENNAPLLRCLYISSETRFGIADNWAGQRQISLDLLAGCAPRLVALHLNHVSFRNWASPILSALESLELHYISRDGPSVSQTLDVLRACPSLQLLKFHAVNFSNTTATSDPVIVLPCLTDINFGNVSSCATANVIQAIQAPTCNRLSITTLDDEFSDSKVYDVVTTWITPSFRRYLRAGGHLDIEFSNARGVDFNITGLPYGNANDASFTMGRRPLRLDSAQLSISLYLPTIPDHPMLLEWGVQEIEFCNSASAALTIHISLNELSLAQSMHSLAVMERLPNIVSLHFIRCELDGMEVILEALASQRSFNLDPSSWLCPNLCRLSCVSSGAKRSVLRMIKARTRAAELGQTMDGASGPALITQLVVRGEVLMDIWTFASIRQALGQSTTCYWELDNGYQYHNINEIRW